MSSKRKKMQKKQLMIFLVPLMLTLIIVPLLVLLKLVDLEDYVMKIRTGQKTFFDFYSYYKAGWLMFFTVTCTVLLVVGFYKKLLTNNKHLIYTIPISIYLLFVFLSSLYSEYHTVSLYGIYDRHEGLLVIACYCFLCYYTYKIINDQAQVIKVLTALFICVTVIDVIGIFQYIGMDLYKSGFGRNLILMNGHQSLKDNLTFEFGKNVMYTTLFHYDYVGSFVAIVLPIIVSMAFYVKQLKYRIPLILLSLATMLVWLGSNARSGIFGVAVAVPFALVVFARPIWRRKMVALLFVGIFIFVGILGVSFAKEGLSARFSVTKLEIQSLAHKFLSGKQTKEHIEAEAKKYPLTDFKVKDNEIYIKTPTETLYVDLEKDMRITFLDENKNVIMHKFGQDNGLFTLENPLYNDYKIYFGNIEKIPMLYINKENLKFFFKPVDGKFIISSYQGTEYSPDPVAKWGFEGMEDFASARGFIWSRTIPLLKKTKVLGYGPDTYLFYFPHQDFVGKVKAYGDMWMVVDKPHNVYLQIAANTGVISLIAFLSLMIIYIIRSLILYCRIKDLELSGAMGIGCLLGVIGYLAAGIFNDSIVCVAPVFWIILGLGIALNRINYKKFKDEPA